MLMVTHKAKEVSSVLCGAATCLVKVDLAELCGGVQRELFWQQRPEARAGQPEHPMRACREVLSRGFSNAPLAAPLGRSVTSSSPTGSVGQDALARTAARIPVQDEQG